MPHLDSILRRWASEDTDIALRSLHDEIMSLHEALWNSGADDVTAGLEARYVRVLDALREERRREAEQG